MLSYSYPNEAITDQAHFSDVFSSRGHWSNCQLKKKGRYKKRLEWKFLLGSEKWLISHAILEKYKFKWKADRTAKVNFNALKLTLAVRSAFHLNLYFTEHCWSWSSQRSGFTSLLFVQVVLSLQFTWLYSKTLFYGNAVSTEIKTAFSNSALKILSKLGCENPSVNNRCKSRECTCLSHDYCKWYINDQLICFSFKLWWFIVSFVSTSFQFLNEF